MALTTASFLVQDRKNESASTNGGRAFACPIPFWAKATASIPAASVHGRIRSTSTPIGWPEQTARTASSPESLRLKESERAWDGARKGFPCPP